MSFIQSLCVIVGAAVLLPPLVYMCVKLGTVGFLRGREFFDRRRD
jgi:hypothetical protein